jgi:hypothetical protein
VQEEARVKARRGHAGGHGGGHGGERLQMEASTYIEQVDTRVVSHHKYRAT